MPTPSSGLQTIFAIFLGLMVTAFVGVAVYTFHPPPDEPAQRRIEELNRREEAIRNSAPPEQLTAGDRARIQELTDDRNRQVDAAAALREAWGRTTSIVLIAFATLAMAVSLVRADQLPVISSGLLLGGVFTMLYGVGWIIATGTSMARLGVMTAALVITLGLGYLRFVRLRVAPAAAGRPAVSGDLGEIERRLRELEDRMAEAANALGRSEKR